MATNDSSENEATKTLVGARPIKRIDPQSENLDDIRPPSEPVLVEEPEQPSETLKAHGIQIPEGMTYHPEPPRSIEATGLEHVFLEELCLKHLYQAGELKGGEISRRACLPPVVIEEIMERLRSSRLVDIKGSRGVGLGRTQTVFTLTKAGHKHCDLALDRDRYVGPAPVPLSMYSEAVEMQSIRGNELGREDLAPHFSDLVLGDTVFEAIGPAMNGGRSLFVHGPAGNGKTAVCQRMIGCFEGRVLVPHAVKAGDFVIKVFDESVHREVELSDDAPLFDERWVLCERPLVVVGGDLTLDDLDLRYSDEVKYYEAPFQLKANCGVLLIDDFGRQKVTPKALLNRWIVPLENEYDFLVTHTGKKLRMPFDVFVIFSTNLDPSTLVDAAFLRRVRYKIEMARPNTTQFRRIFDAECKRQGVPAKKKMVDYLIQQHYKAKKRPFNACEPRDILNQVTDLCVYLKIKPELSEQVIDRVAANYFVDF